MNSRELAQNAARLGWQKKGDNIVILDLRELSDVADYFVILTGESDIHVKSLADFIERELRDEKIKPVHKEGYRYLNWVLLDYVDVIVHIFKADAREYYGLEQLWSDAKLTQWNEDAQDRILSKKAN